MFVRCLSHAPGCTNDLKENLHDLTGHTSWHVGPFVGFRVSGFTVLRVLHEVWHLKSPPLYYPSPRFPAWGNPRGAVERGVLGELGEPMIGRYNCLCTYFRRAVVVAHPVVHGIILISPPTPTVGIQVYK